MPDCSSQFLNCTSCKARLNSGFNELSGSEMDQLNAIKQCLTFKKGELIFREGAFPRGLFCVNTGKIKVAQMGDDGKEQIVHLIHDGSIMGHRAILGDDQYSCSAVAMEDSHVCFIPKEPFYKMVENNAKLALKIAHLLADELKELEKKVTHSVQSKVRDRVANGIMALIENYGFDSDGQTINVQLKREDLANLAGTSRETATRYLYDFQEAGFLNLIGKHIKVVNLDAIQKMAHSKHV